MDSLSTNYGAAFGQPRPDVTTIYTDASPYQQSEQARAPAGADAPMGAAGGQHRWFHDAQQQRHLQWGRHGDTRGRECLARDER